VAIKTTTDGIGSDGKATHTEFAAKYDGKDYPYTGNPAIDTIALKAPSTTHVRGHAEAQGQGDDDEPERDLGGREDPHTDPDRHRRTRADGQDTVVWDRQ